MTTDEEKRGLIAKACGWKMIMENVWEKYGSHGHEFANCPPFYLGDLNEIIAAIRTLPLIKQYLCLSALQMLVLNRYEEGHDAEVTRGVFPFSAEARDYSEAFGRTLNLWPAE